jgi:branched-chain amino acid transport system permease protein
MKSLVTVKQGSAEHVLMVTVGIALVIGALLYIPVFGSNTLMIEATEAFSFMGPALALNLLLGFTGQISIGHSAFVGIGAYSTGVLVTKYGWNPWWTFVAGFVIAFVIGMLVSLPALRIRGAYLALVTLAVALMFPALVRWDKLEWLTGNGGQVRDVRFIGSGEGARLRYEVFGWDPFGDLRSPDGRTKFFYVLSAMIVVLTYIVCRGVVKSRAGRALIAIRDNETAAAVMGVNLMMTKAFVFGLSGALTALMGSFLCFQASGINPDVRGITLLGAITFLVVMVIGGAGSLSGPVVGAVLLVWISNLTSDWGEDDKIPGAFRWMLSWSEVSPSDGIFAILLVVLMFVAPRGVVGMWRQHSWRIVRIEPKPAGTGVAPSDKIAPDVDVNDIPDTPPAEALGLFDTEPGIAEGAPDEIKPL